MMDELPRQADSTVCACCGQTLPPKGLPRGVEFTRRERMIFEVVQAAGKLGISSDRLFDRLYAADPDGGPLTGKKSMFVIIRRMNQKLAAVGLLVRAPGGGNGTTGSYTLRKI